jgi:excisionase family DNA binding protein
MQFLSTREVATRLSVTTDQVIALIRSGRLVAVNVGIDRKPQWRISEDDLDTFLAAARCGRKSGRRDHGK